MVVLHVHALEEQFLVTCDANGLVAHVIEAIEEVQCPRNRRHSKIQAYRSVFKHKPPLQVVSVRDCKGYHLPSSLRVGDVLGIGREM